MKRSADGEWKRSGNHLTDQLHLFETGELYDCTLKAGKFDGNNSLTVGKVRKIRNCTILSITEVFFSHRLGVQVPQAGSVGGQQCFRGHVLLRLCRVHKGPRRSHRPEGRFCRGL